GDNVGVGSNESIRLDAAAVATDGKIFQAWSSTDSPASSFTVIAATGGKSICISGFSNGTENFRATYLADVTAPTSTASGTKADASAYTAGAWTNQNVTVALSATDNAGGAGVK